MITHNTALKVGFIGLGRMGAAMAGSLLQACHDVTVYNRTPNLIFSYGTVEAYSRQ